MELDRDILEIVVGYEHVPVHAHRARRVHIVDLHGAPHSNTDARAHSQQRGEINHMYT